MPDPTPVQGYDCKLYRNTASYASPTWSEITNVRDVKVPVEKDEKDVTTRANAPWEAVAGSLRKLAVEFDMIYSHDDADVVALEDAFYADTQVDLLILDGSVLVAGSTGVRASFEVLKFDAPQPLDNVVIVSVALKPGYNANKPERYTVTT